MDAKEHILSVIDDPRIYDEDGDYYFDDALEAVAHDSGWRYAMSGLVAILEDMALSKRWHDAMVSLFCCDCHTRELPVEPTYLIALLYNCLELHPAAPGVQFGEAGVDDNLVWTIAAHLKGVSYMSDYIPEQDPEVTKHEINR